MLACDLGDDAPKMYEAAVDGGTRRLAIEMLDLMELMNASPWSSRELQCALPRVAPLLRSSYFRTRQVVEKSIPAEKLSLPIVIDVMSSGELCMW